MPCCNEGDSCLCLAVVKENHTSVILWDAEGNARTFTYANTANGHLTDTDAHAHAHAHDNSSSSCCQNKNRKLCFENHDTAQEEEDGFLTPFSASLDQNGLHITQEVEKDLDCVCGVHASHIHAHYYDENLCGNDSKGGDSDVNVEYLTLHPTNDNSIVDISKNDHHHHHDSIPLPPPPSMTSSHDCDALGCSNEHTYKVLDVVKHKDHYDNLILDTYHNDTTNNIPNLYMEHDCLDCGTTSRHEEFTFVSEKRLNNRIQMHFFESITSSGSEQEEVAKEVEWYHCENNNGEECKIDGGCCPSQDERIQNQRRRMKKDRMKKRRGETSCCETKCNLHCHNDRYQHSHDDVVKEVKKDSCCLPKIKHDYEQKHHNHKHTDEDDVVVVVEEKMEKDTCCASKATKKESNGCCASKTTSMKHDHDHNHDDSIVVKEKNHDGCCSSKTTSTKHLTKEKKEGGCCSSKTMPVKDDHDHNHDAPTKEKKEGGCCSSKTTPVKHDDDREKKKETGGGGGCCASKTSSSVKHDHNHSPVMKEKNKSCCSSKLTPVQHDHDHDVVVKEKKGGCCSSNTIPSKHGHDHNHETKKEGSCCASKNIPVKHDHDHHHDAAPLKGKKESSGGCCASKTKGSCCSSKTIPVKHDHNHETKKESSGGCCASKTNPVNVVQKKKNDGCCSSKVIPVEHDHEKKKEGGCCASKTSSVQHDIDHNPVVKENSDGCCSTKNKGGCCSSKAIPAKHDETIMGVGCCSFEINSVNIDNDISVVEKNVGGCCGEQQKIDDCCSSQNCHAVGGSSETHTLLFDYHSANENDPLTDKDDNVVRSTIVCEGICCAAEIPPIRNILERLSGVHQILFNIPFKTVMVDHDPTIIQADSIANNLNKSMFGATVKKDGGVVPIRLEDIDSFEFPKVVEEEDNVVEESATYPKPVIIMAGIFWIVSMLSFIGGNWKYLKYVALASVALGLPPIAIKAFYKLKTCQFETNVLMVSAAIGALALQDFTEAAAVTFLFSISDWLENRATARARNALAEIVRLRPEKANLIHPVSKEIIVVPPTSVPVGASVSVKTGDKIPCDGIIIEGTSTVDESSLTGEHRPVHKKINDKVSGGTVNSGNGEIVVQTTATADNSAVAKLIRLVEEAQANRSETEKMVDEFAKYYTPIVISAGLLMVTVPWAWGRETGSDWTHTGLVLLVVACPCALIISTPVTYVAGLAATAQRGILVKGGAYLEALAMVKKISFDKTGTLTKGDFALLHLETFGGLLRETILGYLALVEERASHPLAQALIAAVENEGVSIPKDIKLQNHTQLAGEGVTVLAGDVNVAIGNERLFRRYNLFDGIPENIKKKSTEWSALGGTVGFMSIEGHGVVCAYCCADAPRAESKSVLSSLKKLGVETIMLTGDNEEAALSVGRQVGLSESQVRAHLLPEEKLKIIQDMKQEELKSGILCKKRDLVLMCGDGVNDAPALATADIGVAMGAGAALAMETSDITLLDSNLEKLLYSLKMGKRVTQKIRQNIIFSFVTKAIVVGFTFAGYSYLWAAIGADVGSMLIVTLNGMTLLPSKKEKTSIEDDSPKVEDII